MRGSSRTSNRGPRLADMTQRGDERLPIVTWRPCYARNIRVRNELVIFAVDTGDLTGDSK
jgi:hypothetical protein